jgi:DNA-directed RNA polymerase specialized sigma24 family protein
MIETQHTINAARPRLSDEEVDPIEQEHNEKELYGNHETEGWLVWDHEDLFDVHRIISERLPGAQRQVIEAYLDGMSYKEIGCSSKYFRYHLEKAIEFIQEELKL